jgi:tRNA pseudouridine13 synthase
MLAEHWNDWPFCLKRMARSWRQGVVAYLADRQGDFRGAMTVVPADLRSLYVAAFQSHLWNGMLAELLRRRLRAEQLAEAELSRWSAPYFRELDPEQLEGLRTLELPLPSARNREEMGPWRELAEPLLASLGLTLEQVRIKRFRETFFSKGSRPALYFPSSLEGTAAADDVYAGRRKFTLRFELPRGSYATILTRRVVLG